MVPGSRGARLDGSQHFEFGAMKLDRDRGCTNGMNGIVHMRQMVHVIQIGRGYPTKAIGPRPNLAPVGIGAERSEDPVGGSWSVFERRLQRDRCRHRVLAPLERSHRIVEIDRLQREIGEERGRM